MSNDDLLTRLACEYATWDEVLEEADVATGCQCIGFGVESVAIFGVSMVKKSSWLAKRERLLNKPSWKDAPEGATHLALDGTIPGVSSCASWHFYIGEPTAGNHLWLPVRGSRASWLQGSRTAIAIPAGYDWKESLEERPA